MTPEEKARLAIDEKLNQSGWVIQDMKRLNLSASLGVAVREFPTSTGEVDYALFVDGKPVGVVEAKREEAGEHITDVEVQSGRYANSTFKWIKNEYEENRKVSSRTKAGTAASSEVFGEWHRRTCQRIRHRAELQYD